MLTFPRHWKIWILAGFVVMAAHALVATALVVTWGQSAPAAASAPMSVTLAMVATTNASHSQVAVAEPQHKPKPKAPEPKPVKTDVAEKYQPKPKPEEKPQLLKPQQQLTHIDAKQADTTQAQQQGGSEQAREAKQRWYGQVLALLQQQKRYPRLALMRGEQGVVKVRFELGRQGQLLSVSLEGSSGYASLDQEALALVQRVAPFPAPPVEVTGAQISLAVPVAFQVNN